MGKQLVGGVWPNVGPGERMFLNKQPMRHLRQLERDTYRIARPVEGVGGNLGGGAGLGGFQQVNVFDTLNLKRFYRVGFGLVSCQLGIVI